MPDRLWLDRRRLGRAERGVGGECLTFSVSTVHEMLLDLDGTPDRSRLGANALLAASSAFARAWALAFDVPLYEGFAHLMRRQPARRSRLTVNLFSAGKHAGGQVPIQDVLVVPAAGRTISEQLATVFDVYQSAANLALRRYGYRRPVADEGGLAPNFPNVERMLEDAVAAIAAAGYDPGGDVALCVDLASSHFFGDGRYQLGPRQSLTASELVEVFKQALVKRMPVIEVRNRARRPLRKRGVERETGVSRAGAAYSALEVSYRLVG